MPPISPETGPHAKPASGRGWLLLHGLIIAHLSLGALYAGWQVFVVLAPEGHVGPLWGLAQDVPTELLMARRMYALEAWLASGALSIYLGLTEILPRRSASL